MKTVVPILIAVCAMSILAPSIYAQGAAAAPAEPQKVPTVASVLDEQLSAVEKMVVSAAEAMPEDKYSFAPTGGEFKGVRTFGEE
jgi:hypothetical protein